MGAVEERVGVVLAAGASKRWGGSPKALLRLGTETALERIVRLLRSAGIHRIRVVLGAHAEQIEARATRLRGHVDWVPNSAWATGRTSSVQVGLRGLDRGCQVVLWPVDHPLVAESTLAGLLEAVGRESTAVWWIPSYRGRGGHPVILREAAWRAVDGLGPDEPLRHLLRPLGDRVRRLPVEDPGVVVNLNTPQEYLAARAEGLPRDG